MKMKIVYLAFYFLLLISVTIGLTGYSTGTASGGNPFIGAPGDFTTCGRIGCHGTVMAYGEPIFEVKIMSLVDSNIFIEEYMPLSDHLIEITIFPEFGTPTAYGFGATILDEDNNSVGVISSPSSNTKISYVSNINRQYAEHNERSESNTFSFVWTAEESGTAIIYVNGVTVNSDSESDGDSGGTIATVIQLEAKSLSVELSQFKALRRGKEVLLEWVTETEESNDYFLIQHSNNGTVFQDIDRIDGAGNSTEESIYWFKS